ncbi:fibrinogen- and Ig-binding protein-like [Littorina saxatilis]|uniref:Uncharacterized protein n=1 Tax=Littorina saxatilis TaxID=31220 RepID=A0AAN9AXN1_9CAEN
MKTVFKLCFVWLLATTFTVVNSHDPTRSTACGYEQLLEDLRNLLAQTQSSAQNCKSDQGMGAVVAQLVAELSSVKDNLNVLKISQQIVKSELQTTKSDLEATKSERQTTNSELQTMKSELQTTNSELQTMKSELQTTNSELQIMKSDLQTTQSKLQTMESEMQTTKSKLQTMELELQTTQSELQATKSELQATQSELHTTKSELQTMESELKTALTDLQSTKLERQTMKTEVNQPPDTDLQAIQKELQWMKEELEFAKTVLNSSTTDQPAPQHTLEPKQTDVTPSRIETDLGSTFIRWGRKSCPTNTTLVYAGVAGGKQHHHKGSGTNRLCLTRTPQFDNTAKPSHYGFLYGAEYEKIPGHHDHDVPCSVCLVPQSTTIMVPATLTCPPGWTPHYTGHLASQRNVHYGGEYVCLDGSPEDDSSVLKDDDGLLFFHTVTVCGSLPCPPYINDKVVTCVVCSK